MGLIILGFEQPTSSAQIYNQRGATIERGLPAKLPTAPFSLQSVLPPSHLRDKLALAQ
jgi:hypothetical protein